jgi:hypothetical protein
MKKILLLVGALLATVAAPAPRYAVAASIAGPDAGGWDYARVDASADRLYVARSGSLSARSRMRRSSPTTAAAPT